MSTNSSITTPRKVEVSITLPNFNLSALKDKLKTIISTIYSNIYSPINNNAKNGSVGVSERVRRMRMPNFKNGFNFNRNRIKILFPLIIGVIILVAVVSIVRSLPDAKSTSTDTTSPVTADAVATIPLDKKLVFPLRDEKGKEVGNFDYVIEAASLQRQIIVQGQRASSVNGRIFLILNLKITNNLKQPIQLNTRDFMRLVVASNTNEQLAPDIHNDPAEVQAISTKYTRVGIAISEADAKKKIELKVGEIDGEKQTIDLNFKY